MPGEPPTSLPFTAVVGMEDAKRALECALVSPRLKTVMIRGGKGSAKSMLARAAAGMSGRGMVNCPLNASEEQIFGGMDVEATMRSGRPVFAPGLLARADGGILYIDDANLMDRAVLAGVLDAVLTGSVRVERGVVSARYDLDVTLVATMNPEEGDLSPHVLDRFDLCAYPSADADRREVLRRNTDFAEDPDGFRRMFADEEAAEGSRIERAVRVLPLVTISDELVDVVSELCVRLGTDGLRGDIAMVNCASALAALNGRDEVTRKDVEEAAVLCLPHRRSYDQAPPPEPHEERGDGGRNPPGGSDGREPPERPEDRSGGQEPLTQPPEVRDVEEMMFEIGRQFRVIDYLGGDGRAPVRTKARKGRRTLAQSADGTGRYARARIPGGKAADVAFDATIRAAAPHQPERSREGVAVVIEDGDIREKVRERRSGTTLLFLVDASGSLGVRRRMATVKGAILSMLRDSYVKRDRIGLMAFRRDSADMILPPTRSVEYSYRMLEELPTGGRTPLGEALSRVQEYMTAYVRCHVGERCFVVLVTDGRANVPLRQGADANEEAQRMSEGLKIPCVRWIVVDASSGFPHFDNAERLAEKLGARYFRLEDLDADRLAEGVKAAVEAGRPRANELLRPVATVHSPAMITNEGVQLGHPWGVFSPCAIADGPPAGTMPRYGDRGAGVSSVPGEGTVRLSQGSPVRDATGKR